MWQIPGAHTEQSLWARASGAGRHLAALPVDARTGKLLVVGAALGCLAPALSIAAAASHKSPFSAPFEHQEAAQRARAALAAPGASPAAAPFPAPLLSKQSW